jgi:trk system potassium uptake protein TrkA
MKVIIVGAGKLGVRLAKAMDMEKIDVTLVDENPKKIDRVNEQLDVLTIEGSGVDIAFLRNINVGNYDLLVATTDKDATNIVICDFAKKLGCKKTIARVRDNEYSDQLAFINKEIGIDLIVNPDLSTANMIAKYLLRDLTYYTGEFANGKIRLVDFNIRDNEMFVQKRIVDLDDFQDLLITAISREDELVIPDGSTLLLENDTIYVLGKNQRIEQFTKKHKLNGTEKPIENVMIVGGGNVGYYLANILSAARVNVKLIEQNKYRAQKLTELLEHVLIINGDGSDLSLLQEEDLEQMQALVSVTGLDELNLLVALIAKHHGVSKAIAKVSRENYTKIINKLQVDAAINPISITVSQILKFIRGDKVESISLVLGGEGEISEVIATKEMPCVGKPLNKVGLPKGILVGAIIHNNEITIASGNSVIMPNDRVIVFVHASKVNEFKSLFIRKKGGLLSEIWGRS